MFIIIIIHVYIKYHGLMKLHYCNIILHLMNSSTVMYITVNTFQDLINVFIRYNMQVNDA